MEKMYEFSETAVVAVWPQEIDVAHLRAIAGLNAALLRTPFPGLSETVPAYASLTFFFDPAKLPAEWESPADDIGTYLTNLLEKKEDNALLSGQTVAIPVCYDDYFGPDLEAVAAYHNCTKATVIERHTALEYTVFMVGFLPGFAYLGSVDNRIATPRRASPRLHVEAGSVGIAGAQTGVYPLDSPGGWQIVGRTPLSVYRPGVARASFLLKTGDTVRFYPISKKDFERINPVEISPAPWDKPLSKPPTAIVQRSGPLAILQDLGRPGYRAFGVPVSGALDQPAHLLANALVGNEPQAATIECTMGGLSLQFCKKAVVAVTGGGAALVNQAKIAHNQAVPLQKNDVLDIIFHQNGMRTYLAVRGGWEGIECMGSKSVCRNAQLGNVLQKGSSLFAGRAKKGQNQPFSKDSPTITAAEGFVLRVMPGPEFEHLDAVGQQQFYQQTYIVSHRSDRMGSRLEGAPLALSDRHELLSTAVAPGTIQRTPDGQLIVLLNDCQTTGGYPRVGQVAAVDLPRLAQISPGTEVHFVPITCPQARFLFLQQQQELYEFFDRH